MWGQVGFIFVHSDFLLNIISDTYFLKILNGEMMLADNDYHHIARIQLSKAYVV